MIKTKRELREAENRNNAIHLQMQNTERQQDDLKMTNVKLSKDYETLTEQKVNLENINEEYRNEIENMSNVINEMRDNYEDFERTNYTKIEEIKIVNEKQQLEIQN